MDCTDLVLIGASHLSNMGKHLNLDLGKVTDLTIPGWRINDKNVASMVTVLTRTANEVDWASATVILQLFDNSVYMVNGPGGEKFLPRRIRRDFTILRGASRSLTRRQSRI